MKKNNIKYIKQTAAVLCAAVLMCGCSAPTADQGSGATAVNETSVSDTTDEADPDSQGMMPQILQDQLQQTSRKA